MRSNGSESRRRGFVRARGFATGVALAACLATGIAAASPEAPNFRDDVLPIFEKSCNGCHNPDKFDAHLDLTTYEATLRGGKTDPSFAPNDPTDSILMEYIVGDEPLMPKEGKPLRPEQIATIAKWIETGAPEGPATDPAMETPAETASAAPDPAASAPETYAAPLAISAMAWSPDGALLAVSGYHEILLLRADGSGVEARLAGASPRIEAIAYSPNGKLLVASGGSPARFGELQVWDAETRELIRADRVGKDTLYGLSISPDGRRAAFGMPDKTARMVALHNGEELLKFDGHTDWVLATVFSVAGDRLLTGARDKAMKLIDPSNGQFIDDINNPLDSILAFSRHPNENVVAYGGESGVARVYRMAENQKRTAARNDTNLVRELERLPGSIHAIAYSPDGASVALGGRHTEVRVHSAADGKRLATLGGHEGAVFAIRWRPDGGEIATAGFEGLVRIFDPAAGTKTREFFGVPLAETPKTVAANP